MQYKFRLHRSGGKFQFPKREAYNWAITDNDRILVSIGNHHIECKLGSGCEVYLPAKWRREQGIHPGEVFTATVRPSR